MASRILYRVLCKARRPHVHCVRTLLSDAYACNNVWAERLSSPVLQNLSVSNYAIQLQDRIDKEGKVTAIDMDILANKLEEMDSHQLDFAQNIFHKFRHTSETVKARPSMHHALVRAFLSHGETEQLLDILKDKVNYGIFLDDYTANILLDHFIESKQYKEAASVAIDQMLQEDFSHPVTRMLSWYACHLRLSSTPVTEMDVDPEPLEDDDGEEEKLVKVKFIINPWFDDHWDLDKESLRLGKTLVLLTEGEQTTLALSYRLTGLALWNKFPEALQLLQSLSKEQTLSQHSVEVLRSSLEAVETQEPPEKKHPGLMRIKDLRPYITAEQKQEYQEQLQQIVSKLESSQQLVDGDLEQQLVDKLKSVVQKMEPEDIKYQTTMFRAWNEERQQLLDKEVKEIQEWQRRRAIAQRLKELQEKEEKLRYFELHDKVKVAQMRAPPVMNIEEVVEEEVFVAPPGERGRNV